MIGELLSSEGTSAALVAALSATVMVLAAKGDGPLSRERLLARVLPDPVARVQSMIEQPTHTHVPAPASRAAA
jgi:hypothetical protein